MSNYTISLCQITEDDSSEVIEMVVAKDSYNACLKVLNQYSSNSITESDKVRIKNNELYYYDSEHYIEYVVRYY